MFDRVIYFLEQHQSQGLLEALPRKQPPALPEALAILFGLPTRGTSFPYRFGKGSLPFTPLIQLVGSVGSVRSSKPKNSVTLTPSIGSKRP